MMLKASLILLKKKQQELYFSAKFKDTHYQNRKLMYNILVIDDDKMTHFVVKQILGEQFNLIHVYDAQEAVNKISDVTVHLILSDIHMPGIDGLEFLESIMADSELSNIPILIMTGKPTVDKERSALDLGAADFINKSLFRDDPANLVERVELKLTTTLEDIPVPKGFSVSKRSFVQNFMEEVQTGDFFTISRKLCTLLYNRFDIDHIFFWVVRNNQPRLILTMGNKELQKFGPDDLVDEETFKVFSAEPKPYLSNHAFGKDLGLFKDASKTAKFPSEIGIPLYEVTDREYLMNDRIIPENAAMFGYLVLKRNKLFTTKEFNFLSKLLIQSGTILWRYFKKV